MLVAELFEIRLEADLSEFDSLVTDGGDLAWSAAAGLAGSLGGLAATIDDAAVIYAQKNFTVTSHNYRFRLYFHPNSLTIVSGFDHVWAQAEEGTNDRVRVWIKNNAGTFQVRAELRRDDGSRLATSYVNISNEEHRFEINVIQASGASANDGACQLYIDGSLAAQITGQDLFALSVPTNLKVGVMDGPDAGTSGTYYIDEIVLRDDNQEIGPVGVFIPPLRAGLFGTFPVPDDWDPETDGFCTMSLTVPNSVFWKAAVKGCIAQLALVDLWGDEDLQIEAAKVGYDILKSANLDCP